MNDNFLDQYRVIQDMTAELGDEMTQALVEEFNMPELYARLISYEWMEQND